MTSAALRHDSWSAYIYMKFMFQCHWLEITGNYVLVDSDLLAIPCLASLCIEVLRAAWGALAQPSRWRSLTRTTNHTFARLGFTLSIGCRTCCDITFSSRIGELNTLFRKSDRAPIGKSWNRSRYYKRQCEGKWRVRRLGGALHG